MSFVRLLADGATEAVTLIPLLFTLGITPAHAQLPRTAVAQAVAQTADQAAQPAQAVLSPVNGATLPTLVAQHMVIELADGEARLRTVSVFRNETDAPIAARYVLPLAGAVALSGLDDDGDAGEDDSLTHPCGGSAPDAIEADAAEFVEAGEPDPRGQESGVLWLAPGDEITLVATRPADVFRRDNRRRVVIALPPVPAGQPAPQFSAEIDVDAPQPIVALGSATHGGDVDGLGGSRARLFIPNGKVYETRFLSVDLELGTAAQEEGRRWGNEDRLPIALR
jgi:hypothetical protein